MNPINNEDLNVMRSIKFYILILSFLFISINYAYAQIIFDDNKLAINSNIDTIGLRVDSWLGMYWTYDNDKLFQLDISPSSPRLAGTDKWIYFFNPLTNTYNSINVENVYNHSDARAKECIMSIDNGLEKIKMLQPVTYKWKNNNDGELYKSRGGTNDNLQYGFLAQDVEKILPDIVLTNSKNEKSINYASFIPLLTNAIQDLQSEIEDNQLKLNKLSLAADKRKCSTKQSGRILKCIYDSSNGEILMTLQINEKAKGATIVVNSYIGEWELSRVVSPDITDVAIDISSFNKGLHIISLMINGKIADSRQIIKK